MKVIVVMTSARRFVRKKVINIIQEIKINSLFSKTVFIKSHNNLWGSFYNKVPGDIQNLPFTGFKNV